MGQMECAICIFFAKTTCKIQLILTFLHWKKHPFWLLWQQNVLWWKMHPQECMLLRSHLCHNLEQRNCKMHFWNVSVAMAPACKKICFWYFFTTCSCSAVILSTGWKQFKKESSFCTCSCQGRVTLATNLQNTESAFRDLSKEQNFKALSYLEADIFVFVF